MTDACKPLFFCVGARCTLFAATSKEPLEHARAVRSQQHTSGPYYLSNLQPSDVPRLARNETVIAQLWALTLTELQLPPDILHKAP